MSGVADDPEGELLWAETVAQWRALPHDVRARVELATLPMDDPVENALVINALQRHATVVVQKSLAEGFGLTVAEAMWKSRPVVASAVGGIVDQIADGETGLLVQDPRDLESFGHAVARLGVHCGQPHQLRRVVDHELAILRPPVQRPQRVDHAPYPRAR